MSFKSARLPHHAQCHNFGMSHAFGDYDLDGKLDLFVVGMSSTTARRLDRLGLGHVQRPRHPAYAFDHGLWKPHVPGAE